MSHLEMELKLGGKVEIGRTKAYVNLRIYTDDEMRDELRKIFGGSTISLTIEEAGKVIKQMQESLDELMTSAEPG